MRIIEGDLLAGAVAFAREVAGKPAPKTRERDEKLRDADPAIFDRAREQAAQDEARPDRAARRHRRGGSRHPAFLRRRLRARGRALRSSASTPRSPRP